MPEQPVPVFEESGMFTRGELVAWARERDGMILEDDGKLQMRLGLIAPPDDPARPWRVPLALRLAFRFEPARAMAMRPNELAETVLAGFVRAVEGLGRT